MTKCFFFVFFFTRQRFTVIFVSKQHSVEWKNAETRGSRFFGGGGVFPYAHNSYDLFYKRSYSRYPCIPTDPTYSPYLHGSIGITTVTSMIHELVEAICSGQRHWTQLEHS